jgi:hypothetical protein
MQLRRTDLPTFLRTGRPTATDPCQSKGQIMNRFFKLLLGTGLYLLEQDRTTKNDRDRTAGQIDDFRNNVLRKYDAAADRVGKASRVLRGEDDHAFGNALRLATGIGVGIGIGVLLAPASGQKTRTAIARKAQELTNKLRKQVSPISKRAHAAANAG